MFTLIYILCFTYTFNNIVNYLFECLKFEIFGTNSLFCPLIFFFWLRSFYLFFPFLPFKIWKMQAIGLEKMFTVHKTDNRHWVSLQKKFEHLSTKKNPRPWIAVAALLMRALNWKWPKGPSIIKWINKGISIKVNKLPIHIAT